MSNPFSSALNYLSGHSGGGVSEGGSRFVGQVVDLGGKRKLKVKKVIAEGMFLISWCAVVSSLAVPNSSLYIVVRCTVTA